MYNAISGVGRQLWNSVFQADFHCNLAINFQNYVVHIHLLWTQEQPYRRTLHVDFSTIILKFADSSACPEKLEKLADFSKIVINLDKEQLNYKPAGMALYFPHQSRCHHSTQQPPPSYLQAPALLKSLHLLSSTSASTDSTSIDPLI